MAKKRRAYGCWTCHVRHVKCDRAQAACKQCTTRRIHCHGYGPKPAWIDGAQQEANERERIKREVNKNFRRLKSGGHQFSAGNGQGASPPEHLPQPMEHSPSLTSGFPQDESFDNATPSNQLDVPPNLESHGHFQPGAAEPLPYDAESLLMHYLDHIFHMQYPYYSNSLWNRGWLLWLLNSNGPLYKASMGLAALHQRSLSGGSEDDGVELELHTRALRELLDVISQSTLKKSQATSESLVKIVSCGVTLISFEVLKGSTTDWQPHLQAMASLILSTHYTKVLSTLTFPSPENKCVSALSFHVLVLLWMDILACVATGRKPLLPYVQLLDRESLPDLVYVMGCRDGVMKAIGDLGALTQWAHDDYVANKLDWEELSFRKSLIEDTLEATLAALPMAFSGEAKQLPNRRCVTRIFAAAALVQLHALDPARYRTGPRAKVRRAVTRVILEIGICPEPPSARRITWPICIAGCMAEPDQRPFFEDLLSTVLAETDGLVGNCETVLKVMHSCWQYQAEQPHLQWDCNHTMSELGIQALLI